MLNEDQDQLDSSQSGDIKEENAEKVALYDTLKTLAEYSHKIRTEKKLSLADVSKRGGISKSWVGALESGALNTCPKPSTLKGLAKGLGVSLDDILKIMGSLSPVSTGLTKPNEDQLSGKRDESHLRYMNEKEASFEEMLAPLGEFRPFGRMVRLPLYGFASCGSPLVIPDNPEEFLSLPEEFSKGTDGGFIVKGTSLQAIGYVEGDLLLVRKLDGAKPQPGKKVIVNVIGDGCMCKIYREDPKWGAYLESAPGDGDPAVIHITENMRIVAQVVRRISEE